MRILGISAHHRDAAAALVVDGRVVAAAQEERFTGRALDPAFPTRAIRWCLASADVASSALDRVVFYEKPLRKFERVLSRSVLSFPRSARSFPRNAFAWLGERLWIRNRIAQDLALPPGRVLFLDQASAQLANAFLTSPFEEAALLLLDDACEWASTALGHGRGAAVEVTLEVRHPHSLGLFASALTQFLGFAPGEDEEKLEALAAHGTPSRVEVLAELVRERGPFFEVDERACRFDDGAERLLASALEARLGGARRAGEPLSWRAGDARHADLAASAQALLEARALALAEELARRVPSENLCLAGLLASNRRLVASLAERGPFRRVHVPAAPGKAGGALGAALLAHHVLDPRPRGAPVNVPESALGPELAAGTRSDARELGSALAAVEELARRLAAGELVGWARGRLEFATRSSGGRVALAAPAPGARARLLAALGEVEGFLPCRIALPESAAERFLELSPAAVGPAELGGVLVRSRDALRDAAPEALLPDGRVWPRIVREEHDPELHALLTRVGEARGAPLLLLADLALRGSPLVRDEAEACEAFARSGLDALVAGERLYARP
jgi:carbamoyltransferase